jgi:hypothetical protein
LTLGCVASLRPPREHASYPSVRPAASSARSFGMIPIFISPSTTRFWVMRSRRLPAYCCRLALRSAGRLTASSRTPSIQGPSRQTSSDTPAASRRPSTFARPPSKAPRHPCCWPPPRLSRASTVDISTTARRRL